MTPEAHPGVSPERSGRAALEGSNGRGCAQLEVGVGTPALFFATVRLLLRGVVIADLILFAGAVATLTGYALSGPVSVAALAVTTLGISLVTVSEMTYRHVRAFTHGRS